jgi:phage baseplate assembly protein W
VTTADDILASARATGSAVQRERVGVDRYTGKIVVGEEHEKESVIALLSTRYHERLSRRWVGSFVPHMLGMNATARSLVRFSWSVATSIDLWEPNWTVKAVNQVPGAADAVLAGGSGIKIRYIRSPRGHLGDRREADEREVTLTYQAKGGWGRFPV